MVVEESVGLGRGHAWCEEAIGGNNICMALGVIRRHETDVEGSYENRDIGVVASAPLGWGKKKVAGGLATWPREAVTLGRGRHGKRIMGERISL